MEALKAFSAEKCCYVDESGFMAFYNREYGYALRGEKVFDEVSGMRFARTNMVAGQLNGKMIAPMYYDEHTNSAVFEVWFEGRLMSALSPGDVVIMDNAPFHREAELRGIAMRHRVEVLFLPPYSPEYNPIEKLWANMKRWLRQHMREYDSFEDALEAAIDAYE